jgi:DNA polymerase-3 subunit gamma/tau
MQAAPMQAGAPRAQAAVRPEAQVQSAALSSAPVIESLADVVQLAKANGARTLATQLETNVHLVSLEPGRIQFRPNALAPATLAGDLAQRLRDWTGVRWIVTLASAGGAPTIVEARSAADRAQKDALSQEPFVRAVLDAFPGAEIVAVRERDEPDSGLPPVLSDDDLESGEEPA